MFSQTQASRDHQSGRLVSAALGACFVAVAVVGCASRAAPSGAGTGASKHPAVVANSSTAVAATPTVTSNDAVDPGFPPVETGIPMNPDVPFNPPTPPPASPKHNSGGGRSDGVIWLPPPILVGQATQSPTATPSH